jgi:hypothetical protein
MSPNYKSVKLDMGENWVDLYCAETNRLLGIIHVKRKPEGGFPNKHYEQLEIEVENGQGAVFEFERVEIIKRR